MARLTAALGRWRLFLSVAGVQLTIPTLAQAQRLGGGGSLDISLVRIVTALLLCLMLAALAALLLKRSGGKIDLTAIRALFAAMPVQRRIEVVETRRVSQYADLCLVRCDGREFLILCSQQQQLVLRETPAAPPADDPPGEAA